MRASSCDGSVVWAPVRIIRARGDPLDARNAPSRTRASTCWATCVGRSPPRSAGRRHDGRFEHVANGRADAETCAQRAAAEPGIVERRSAISDRRRLSSSSSLVGMGPPRKRAGDSSGFSGRIIRASHGCPGAAPTGPLDPGRNHQVPPARMHAVSTESGPLTFAEAQRLVLMDPAMDAAMAKVHALDFTMLRSKLIAEKGWTAETADEIEDLYRRFLALNVRYPGRKICPTGPIDEFWHAHILDTRAYAADCDRLFGEFLHHFPYFGLRGPEDAANLERAFADSVELFIRHFGIDPTAGDSNPRSCRPQRCP